MRRVSYDWKVYFMIGFTVSHGLPVLPAHSAPAAGGHRDLGVNGVPVATPTGQAVLVAIYILVVGIWWSIRQARKEQVSQRLMINDQVGELVNAFRSVFRIRPTVFSALEEANRKMPPPVGTAVAHAVTTFYVTSLPRRAFDELHARIENPYMEQFVYILERGEDAKHEDIMSALERSPDPSAAGARDARPVRGEHDRH